MKNGPLLVVVLSDSSEREDANINRLWREHVEVPSDVAVWFASELELKGSTESRTVYELLRILNARARFDRVLLVRNRCFVRGLWWMSQPNPPKSPPAPALRIGRLPGDAYSPIKTKGDPNAILIDRSVVVRVAEWPDIPAIDRFLSGLDFLTTALGQSSIAPFFDPSLVKHPSLPELHPNNDDLYRASILVAAPTLPPEQLSVFFAKAKALPDHSATSLLTDGLHHDARWLDSLPLRRIPPDATQRIVARNLHVVDDFKALESRLSGDEQLAQYIADRNREIGTRVDQEYTLLRELPETVWPYGYLQAHNHPSTPNRKPFDSGSGQPPITFVFAIKARAERTRLALRSLLSKEVLALAHVLIVEDESEDLLDIHDLPFSGQVEHHVVRTEVAWTRAKLLNFGAKMARTRLIAACDADFLFPPDFPTKLAPVLSILDFDRALFRINAFETETHLHMDGCISRGAPYGYLWVFDRAQFLGVRGFDEDFTGWGHEERELERRLCLRYRLRPIESFQIDPQLRILHLSHVIRTGNDRSDANALLRLERSQHVRWAANPQGFGHLSWVEQRRYLDQGTMTQDCSKESQQEVEMLQKAADQTASSMKPGIVSMSRMHLEHKSQESWHRIRPILSRARRALIHRAPPANSESL
jgi:hypothetical protein